MYKYCIYKSFIEKHFGDRFFVKDGGLYLDDITDKDLKKIKIMKGDELQELPQEQIDILNNQYAVYHKDWWYPFGLLLQEYRKKANMSLDMVVDATGISKSYLSQIESGLRTPLINDKLNVLLDMINPYDDEKYDQLNLDLFVLSLANNGVAPSMINHLFDYVIGDIVTMPSGRGKIARFKDIGICFNRYGQMVFQFDDYKDYKGFFIDSNYRFWKDIELYQELKNRKRLEIF